MNTEPITVCIAGMHRSGTSMVAQLLHLCGLFLGDEKDMWGATHDNPEGHWEHIQLARINDEILNALGGGWDCPPAMPARFDEDAQFRAFAAKARAIQQECFPQGAWGWKDPRNSITFPFWQSLWPDLKTVICLRNPLEVAVSLRRRGLSSYAFGLNLWKTYNLRLLEATAPERRIVTHYEAYFADPKAELRRLSSFLNLPVSGDVLKRACAGIKLEHRRNRFTTLNLLDAQVSPDVVQMYVALCAEAGWSGASASATSALPFSALNEARRMPPVDAALVELELSRHDLQVSSATIGDLRSRLAEANERATRATQEIALRNSREQELKRQLAEATDRAARAAEEIALRDSRERELHKQVTEATERAVRVAEEIALRDSREHARQRQLAEAMGKIGHAAKAVAERDKTIETQRTLLQEQEAAWRRTVELQSVLECQGRRLETLANEIARALQTKKDADYKKMVRRVCNTVRRLVPRQAKVLVISKGDPALVQFDGHRAWHFPHLPDGAYAGHHPADCEEAITGLEQDRKGGAQFLVVPNTALWWLEDYPRFRRHLEKHYGLMADHAEACLIFDLRPSNTHEPIPQ